MRGFARSGWGPARIPYAIEIITDEGVSGVATNYGGGPFACGVIEKHFSRFLIGQDPFNIELIWDQMYRSVMPYGLGGVTAMAMSGVDLALWDLMGKALGQPVYRLAGGKTKESIPCYITTHPDCVKAWKDRGFLGVKIAAPWGAADGRDGLNKMQKCVEQTRAELGNDMEIMIDCYMSWDMEFSSRLAAARAGLRREVVRRPAAQWLGRGIERRTAEPGQSHPGGDWEPGV